MADDMGQATLQEAIEENEKPNALSNPKVRRGLITAALFVIIAAGIWYYRHESFGKYQQSTDNAYIAADSVVVSSKVAGYVDHVFVTENQSVKEGDSLAQLDVRDYRAQSNQVAAQIAATLAGADTVRAQQREQDAAIAQARAQLEAATVQAALAREQVSRYSPLAASGAEPREKLEQLQTQAREAQAQVASARAGLLAAQRRQGTLGKQIQQADSQANAARAQLEAARLNLSATTLRASITGRVGDLTVRPGQYVQPGQRLMSVVPTDRIYVTANFKETQLGLIRQGQPVTLEVDALPDLELEGRVESIAPGTGAEFSVLPPQNATGNFTKIVQRIPVRIAITATPEIRRLLVPGMSVEATVDTRGAKGELTALSARAR
ncbi:HlyD family secretion protein [Blastomonas sp. CCH5-A3]|jgi:membrane fusion protein (multidrug efflux system)|uniref:HlyD family secretion protein n=1 Tax=Blastomonas sp. CCH5-A3 TaxID=1768761 RepID=UPI000AC70A51|nr:HlyD family secretion protein [Blastomonas sp. CCH5-A3]|tara:strand:+ start:19393 stop:20532 length:1140 start_codon:yes stop_codon:yes gene_type:complete